MVQTEIELDKTVVARQNCSIFCTAFRWVEIAKRTHKKRFFDKVGGMLDSPTNPLSNVWAVVTFVVCGLWFVVCCLWFVVCRENAGTPYLYAVS